MSTPDTSFPVDSFKEAASHLRRPFTPQAVKFKVQATWPKDDPTGALIVTYIDARLVVERLNLIVPHLWFDEYEPTPKGLMWCKLTIDGITRRDVGEGDGKGLVSDAFKRAGVKFGIGVSLYATPKLILNAGEFLKAKRTNKGPTLELTPAGENRVRQLYAAWLDQHGKQVFGDPLDHGDVEDAQGDPEAGEPVAAAAGESASTNGHAAAPELLADEHVDTVLAAIAHAKMGTGWVRSQLVALGAPDVPEGTLTKGTIQQLTPEQAVAMVQACNQAAAAKSVEVNGSPS